MKKRFLKMFGIIVVLALLLTLNSTVVFANEATNQNVTVYYANGDWRYTPANISVPAGQDYYLSVLNSLVKGENLPQGCFNEFPSGTKINSFKIENGVAYVDVSKVLVDKLTKSNLSTDVAKDILSYNILSFDDSITDVVFTFDGEKVKNFVGIKKSEFFEVKKANMDVINKKLQEVNEKFKDMTPDQVEQYIQKATSTTSQATNASITATTALICVDPGHGGSDPGAVSGTTKESNLNLAIGLALRDELIKSNFSVIMTRTTDVAVDLTVRYSKANNNSADVFISTHCNSVADTTVKGTTVVYPNNHDITLSQTLAGLVQSQVVKYTGFVNRAPYQDTRNLAVLRNTTMPAIITETGFLSNSSDLTYLKNSTNQITIGKSIAYGVVAWYLP